MRIIRLISSYMHSKSLLMTFTWVGQFWMSRSMARLIYSLFWQILLIFKNSFWLAHWAVWAFEIEGSWSWKLDVFPLCIDTGLTSVLFEDSFMLRFEAESLMSWALYRGVFMWLLLVFIEISLLISFCVMDSEGINFLSSSSLVFFSIRFFISLSSSIWSSACA